MLMALSPVLSHGVANSMALIHFTNCRDCWLYSTTGTVYMSSLLVAASPMALILSS